MVNAWARQAGAAVRFEWGPTGVEAIAADHVVIVDVLRFTTAVEAAVARSAVVYPYRWKDSSAADFARDMGAQLADGTDPAGPSLSPVRLSALDPGDRVVLPSPNGSTCAAIASEQGATVVAGCLRNAAAVADWLRNAGGSVAVIACGERWHDGTLRPSLEDHLGAGAVLTALGGDLSPEAEAAASMWSALRSSAPALVRDCASGREQMARGWESDLDYAVQVDVSGSVPVLRDGAFTDATARPSGTA